MPTSESRSRSSTTCSAGWASFLNVDQQEEIGILSPEVRARLAAGYANGGTVDPAAAPAAPVEAAPPGQTALFNAWEDAVECSRCGGRMRRLLEREVAVLR